MNIKRKMQRGFTILEVIIVLVIAAIVMLAVFLVVPQLQNSQKNSRIRDDARRVLAAFIQQTQTGPIMTNTSYPLNGSSPLWLNGIIGPLRAPNGTYYNATYRNAIPNLALPGLSDFYDLAHKMLVVTQACGSIAAQPTATTSTAVYSVTFYQYQANGSAGSGCIDNQ